MVEWLTTLGGRVARLREERGLTVEALAAAADAPVDHIAALEAGRGAMSLGSLARVAEVLGVAPRVGLDAVPVPGSAPPPVVALLGIRGAGKSTIGARVARALGVTFVELDDDVQRAAGQGLGELFATRGAAGYLQVARERLSAFLASGTPAVLALGGSIVTDADARGLLAGRALTVWLKARAKDHWFRVIAQGDDRPMRRNPEAFAQLEALIGAREPLYRGADLVVDTSERSVDGAVGAIVDAVRAAR